MPEPILFTHIPPEQRPWSDDDTDPVLRVKAPLALNNSQLTMVGMPVVLMTSRVRPYRVNRRRERLILLAVVFVVITLFVTFGVFIVKGLVKMAPTPSRHVTVTTSSVPSKVSR